MTTLLNNTRLLEYVKFVESSNRVSRGVTIKSPDSLGVYGSAFTYNKDGMVHSTSERCVNDLFNDKRTFYFQVEFKNKFQTHQWVAVLEKTPYETDTFKATDAQKEYIDTVLDQAREKYEVEELDRLIDLSLKENDKAAFMKLTNKKLSINK
jgi:uncharacterized protein YpiB (UPF0302 family)